MNKEKRKEALYDSIFEYLVITLPVGFYVLLEAIHNHDFLYFITSPEWTIASVFLSFVCFRGYITAIRKSNKNIRESVMKLLSILNLLLTTTAIGITIFSIFFDNIYLTIFRVAFFVLISIIFISLMGGSKLIK